MPSHRSSSAGVRGLPLTVLVAVVLAAVALMVLGTWAVAGPGAGSGSGAEPGAGSAGGRAVGPEPVDPAPARSGFPASDVLRHWDRQRAAAFATGDPVALERLYVAGSAAGSSDVALLRTYLRRGLRVVGLRMQVIRLEVLVQTPRLLRLRVTDRLTGASVVDASGGSTPLPRDQVSTHVVVLHRAGGGPWRVAEVRS